MYRELDSGYDNVRNPASGACRQGPNFVGRKGRENEKKFKKKKKEKKRKGGGKGGKRQKESKKKAENFDKNIIIQIKDKLKAS